MNTQKEKNFLNRIFASLRQDKQDFHPILPERSEDPAHPVIFSYLCSSVLICVHLCSKLANTILSKMLCVCILCLLLAGCRTGPTYEPPALEMPDAWHSTPSQGMSEKSPDNFLWWRALNDPTLDWLIEEASSQNLDLLIASTRILEARELSKVSSASKLPHIDASASFGHVNYSKDALIHGLLGKKNGATAKKSANFFEVGFDADWEIDLFGVSAHEASALKARLEAAEEGFCDVWITLSAEIAKNYIQLRGFQKRLEILKKNMDSQSETISINKDLMDTGLTTNIDILQAEQQMHLFTAEYNLLQLSINKAVHRLSILLGCPPQELFCELRDVKELPALPFEKPIGVPSELLKRRPDIRKSERELAAASAEVAKAVSSLFPRFSLRGFIGDITTHLPSLFSSGAQTSFLGPQVLAPIFNSRMLKQDVNINKIKVEAAFYQYQKVVLESLEETENAIASFHAELERSKALQLAYQADLDAYELSYDLFEQGLKDYLEVVILKRALLATEESYVQSQIQLLLQYIAVYKALGGGWCLESN